MDSRLILESLLRQQTPVTFRAGGPSMHPVIRDGDNVHVIPIAGATVKPGSILLYRHHGRLVLHRLIRRDAAMNQFIMAADAATSGLEIIEENDIVGYLIWVQQEGKTIPLDTWRARGTGLMRYHLRPFRRGLIRLVRGLRKANHSA